MMVARWSIDAKFGYKQDVIDAMHRWLREVGPQVGVDAATTRLYAALAKQLPGMEVEPPQRIGHHVNRQNSHRKLVLLAQRRHGGRGQRHHQPQQGHDHQHFKQGEAHCPGALANRTIHFFVSLGAQA